MKDLQNLGHMSLTTLVSRLREGRFVIPDFQREFEWQPGDISALMNSIFRDYYIGSLYCGRARRRASTPLPASLFMVTKETAAQSTSCLTDSSV